MGITNSERCRRHDQKRREESEATLTLLIELLRNASKQALLNALLSDVDIRRVISFADRLSPEQADNLTAQILILLSNEGKSE